MKLYISIFIAGIVFVVSSCRKDLDIENPNQPTVEVFWKSENDAIAGVNAVYSTLHRGAISRWMPFYHIVRSDEGRSTSPATEIVNNMDQFQVTDYNFWGAYDIWKDVYVGIFRSNQVIDNVSQMDIDAAVKERVLGEAKFLRGLFYFNLVTLWGNVPVMLKSSTPNDRPGTSNQNEVWAQIERDFTDALTVLPETYTDAADVGRATKGAAYGMLARAYLQQRKYNEALVPLQWLVEGQGSTIYGLLPDYRDNFLITTENNRESIFEWQFQLNPSENHDDDTDPRSDNLNYGNSIAQFFAPAGVGWSDGEANRWPIWEFLQENTITGERDPRLAASLLYDSTDVAGPDVSMIYGQTFSQRYGAGNTRAWFRKLLNDHWKEFEGYNSPNNWRYLRYSDVLLMYSEALNATGNTADAYMYVDRVRQRAGLARLSVVRPGLTPDQFLAQIKHERITELLGEGHRWNDLARWGDLGPQLSGRDPAFNNFVRGRHELLPVPQAEIDINPNLNQNPSW